MNRGVDPDVCGRRGGFRGVGCVVEPAAAGSVDLEDEIDGTGERESVEVGATCRTHANVPASRMGTSQ